MGIGCILNGMDELEIQKNIPWLLWRHFLMAKPELITLAEANDLTLMQMFALCLLEPDSEVPMNSLSGMLHCDASNVTGIVDRLVTPSFVQRQESTRDRRIKIIKLMPDGLALREKLLAEINHPRTPDLGRLSPQEAETLSFLLNKLLPET